MQSGLKMVRIQAKLDEMFTGKIALSDVDTSQGVPTEFYTRAIAALAVSMRCGIDDELAAQSVTDGYHDMGIDAVFNDTAQKKLILVQSKWRKDGNGGVSQEEAGAFVQGIKRIIHFDFNGCNSKLEAKRQDIESVLKDMNYQIEIVFVHTGNQGMSDYAMRPINELLTSVNGDESTELLLFTETRLQDIYEYLANGQASDNIVIDDVILSNWGVVETPFKAYYGTIPASAIGKWYSDFGNRLFAKNIRYYKGSTEVNQGIKDVLKTEPDKFFYYNNGVKVLCKKITRKAAYSVDRNTGLFVLEGVSLVNGAQTTGAIGSIFAETPEALGTAKVLIEMIDLGESDEKQATIITKLSNTQNRIDGKDFASLDPQQERLRMELSLAGVQYLYKAGAIIDDPQHQISLDEAIVAQACALDDLSIIAQVKGNVGALTENVEKAPYKLLFNGGTNSFALFNGVQILRAVESFIKQNEAVATSRKRLALIHGNRFILHFVLAQIKTNAEYNTTHLDPQYIVDTVNSICPGIWDKTYETMEAKFADAYPAYIFKNVGKVKEIATSIQ